MDRRTFLSRSLLGTGALALGAPALASGCGSMPRIGGSEATELLARLERGLDRVRGVPAGTMARELRDHPQPELAERMMRLGLEALVLLDVTRSIPQGAELPDALAERLGPELPVLDRYAATYSTLLVEMPRTARRRLDRKMRERPDATMQIAGWIDEHARSVGSGAQSRLILRSQAADVDVRVRRQSAGAVIDDCVAKVERVVERTGTSISLARSSATSAMIAAMWQDAGDVPRGGGVLGSQLAPPSSAGATRMIPAELRRLEEDRLWAEATTPDQLLWSARWGSPGDTEIEIGAALMPFGLVTCGFLLIVGLIVMAVGLAQNASWDGSPRVPQ